MKGRGVTWPKESSTAATLNARYSWWAELVLSPDTGIADPSGRTQTRCTLSCSSNSARNSLNEPPVKVAKTVPARFRSGACFSSLSLSQTYWLAVDRESGDADL